MLLVACGRRESAPAPEGDYVVSGTSRRCYGLFVVHVQEVQEGCDNIEPSSNALEITEIHGRRPRARVSQGRLLGAEGWCTLSTPDPERYLWEWSLGPLTPGFRGTLQCAVGACVSPIVAVVGDEVPAPAEVDMVPYRSPERDGPTRGQSGPSACPWGTQARDWPAPRLR